MMSPTLRFADLNPLGRAIIIAVAFGTALIAAAAFLLSYGALYAWVHSTGLYADAGPWAGRLEQAWPLMLDAAFIVAELAAILGGILRGPRGWPILVMILTGTLTVVFNVLHAATPAARVAAALPPVLMMACFQIDLAIVGWVMRALGRSDGDVATGAFLGVPQAPPQVFGGYGAGTYPPQGAYGEMPSSGQQRAGQNGHDRGWKAEQTREYLSTLNRGELAGMTRGQLAADMHTLGVPIDETYAGSILGKHRANGTGRKARR